MTYFMGRADKRYTKSSAEELRDLLEDTQAGNMNSESVKKLRNRLSDDFSDAELVKGLKLGNSSKYLCEGSGYNVRFLSTGGIAAFLEKKAHAGVLMINDKTSQQNSNPAKSQKDETPSGAVDESKPTAGRI